MDVNTDYSAITYKMHRTDNWLMCQFFLQLNKNKTEVFIFGQKKAYKGVWWFKKLWQSQESMDGDLNLDHIKFIIKTEFWHLKILPELDECQ